MMIFPWSCHYPTLSSSNTGVSREKGSLDCLFPNRQRGCSPRLDISHQTDVKPLKTSRLTEASSTPWSKEQWYRQNTQPDYCWIQQGCHRLGWNSSAHVSSQRGDKLSTHTVGPTRILPLLLIAVHHPGEHSPGNVDLNWLPPQGLEQQCFLC